MGMGMTVAFFSFSFSFFPDGGEFVTDVVAVVRVAVVVVIFGWPWLMFMGLVWWWVDEKERKIERRRT